MQRKEENPFYRRWLRQADPDDRRILEAMSDSEAADAFGEPPSFGTGGIRKAEGPGINRINPITVRWAAAATAKALLKKNEAKARGNGVVITFDTRVHSRVLAKEAALTVAGFSVPVLLTEEPTPVPFLSFLLKNKDYAGGVMITASHNPATDNGFKVYNENGGQLIPKEADLIEKHIKKTDPFLLRLMTEEEAVSRGLLRYGGKEEETAYLSAVCPPAVSHPLTVVATPLHGAAAKLLPAALKRCGHHLIEVPKQKEFDGTFPTVKAPNPEDPAVFDLAEKYGREHNAPLLLATDGDGDRCGCGLWNGTNYRYLTGNEIASLLISFLLEKQKEDLPADGYIVRTAVSGTTGEKIAASYGIPAKITPTGFKHIGALANDPANGTFLCGYEESGGFLAGNHTADKDGIATSLLLAAFAAEQAEKGQTLLDRLTEIENRFGCEYTAVKTFAFPGKDGETRKIACMNHISQKKSETFTVKPFDRTTVFFDFGEKTEAALRPSGTEPQLKLYYRIGAKTHREATEKRKKIDAFLLPEIEGFLPG